MLYFSSTVANGENGELRILERATGRERVLATNINTEDAHRVACQQWSDGGKQVVYHDYRDGKWLVATIDVESGKERILAEERQLCFGSPRSQWVPIYGYHWKQGAHRDLELVNVTTGEIKTVVKISDVLAEYGDQLREWIGDGQVSVFFPQTSPDDSRVFFKLSVGSGGDNFRSKSASKRDWKVVYDLNERKFLALNKFWGHPSWTPDSGGIIERGNIIGQLPGGTLRGQYAKGSPSDHPSVSPDSKLFVTDACIWERDGMQKDEWGITVGEFSTNEYATIHHFIHTNGARSWRGPHPHPAFSADGKRIYFNVSDSGWTRLYVAEKAE